MRAWRKGQHTNVCSEIQVEVALRAPHHHPQRQRARCKRCDSFVLRGPASTFRDERVMSSSCNSRKSRTESECLKVDKERGQRDVSHAHTDETQFLHHHMTIANLVTSHHTHLSRYSRLFEKIFGNLRPRNCSRAVKLQLHKLAKPR